MSQDYDVVFIDLDSDPDYAFDMVESLCAIGAHTVMVYSTQADLKMAIRFMRAGAQEFLTLPLGPSELTGVLARVSLRGEGTDAARKLFVFSGAKGGCGVTTVAANFAVALAQESAQNTLLIDLGLPLGDAAINLGIIPEYSTADAFQDANRLDASFLSSLLARHSSGLFVLAAPREFAPNEPSHDAIEKLLAVARRCFDYVVVDAGSRVDLMRTPLFEESAIVYLVTEAGISELRNSNRLIARFFAARGRSLQIVLNRDLPHDALFDDRQIAKALTRTVQWRIPDGYATTRRTHNTGAALAMKNSPISLAIRKMARVACGLPANRDKKSSFRLFIREFWPFPKASRETAESRSG
jgi:pilus assembly protein CpaE